MPVGGMSVGTTKTRMTEEEFLRLPDDGRKYELVAGAPKEVPASIRYDIIGMTVRALIRPAANGMGYVVGPQAGWRVRSSNIRCPRVFRVRGTVCVAYVSGKPDRKSLHIPYRVKSVSLQDEIDGGQLLPDFRCVVSELFALVRANIIR